MNNLVQIVNSLENKVSKLLQKQDSLKQENLRLSQQNKDLEKQLVQQHQLNNDLEVKYESLKVANAIVGSKEDKHATKLKINTLIREIDKCIVQLSD
jgi:hypothetical protein